ncbi:MAG: hypothetical protein ABIA04_06255 [Pseudomonadota bacterium]
MLPEKINTKLKQELDWILEMQNTADGFGTWDKEPIPCFLWSIK